MLTTAAFKHRVSGVRVLLCLALPGEGERAVPEAPVCRALPSAPPALPRDVQSGSRGEGQGGMNELCMTDLQPQGVRVLQTPTQAQRDRWGSAPGQGHGSAVPSGNLFVICGGESAENGCSAGRCRGAPGAPRSCVASSPGAWLGGRSCFDRRVGLDDPQRSLPTPTIL